MEWISMMSNRIVGCWGVDTEWSVLAQNWGVDNLEELYFCLPPSESRLHLVFFVYGNGLKCIGFINCCKLDSDNSTNRITWQEAAVGIITEFLTPSMFCTGQTRVKWGICWESLHMCLFNILWHLYGSLRDQIFLLSYILVEME